MFLHSIGFLLMAGRAKFLSPNLVVAMISLENNLMSMRATQIKSHLKSIKEIIHHVYNIQIQFQFHYLHYMTVLIKSKKH